MDKETEIISFYTQKGGSGKTTLTHMVALALASEGNNKTILVLDSDPQHSLVNYLEDIRTSKDDPDFNPPYELIKAPIINLREQLNDKWGKYDYIFLDLPGTMEMEGVRDAILFCNKIFIPIQPSILDLNSAKDTIHKIIEIKKLKNTQNEDLEFYCLLNQSEPNKLSTKGLIEFIKSNEIPHLETPMPRYEKYKYVFTDFTNILENSKWGNEEQSFSNLIDEIKTKLN
jgi:chromosome partitioning protein